MELQNFYKATFTKLNFHELLLSKSKQAQTI